MEAYVKTFRVPQGVEVYLEHDGSAGYGPDSYAIKASIRLGDGTLLSAEERMERNNYNHPEGIESGFVNRPSVARKLANLLGKLYRDYFLHLNSGQSSRLEVVLNREPERVKLARAY